MSNPTIAGDNRLDQDILAMSPTPDSDFPIANAHDGRVFTVAKPGTSGTTVTITTDAGLGNTVDVDCFGLVGHDLSDPAQDGNGAVQLKLQYSDNMSAWSDIFTVTPTDDSIIFRTFAKQTRRGFRIELTRGSAFIPSIGELLWGLKTEAPYGTEVRFDPEDERVVSRYSRSQSGQLLGAVVQFRERMATIRIPLVEDTWLRSQTKPDFGWLWENVLAAMKPFFFSWNPGNPGSYEKDSFFGLFDPEEGIRRPLATQLASGYRDLELRVVGVRD